MEDEESVQKSFYDLTWKAVKPGYDNNPGIPGWKNRLPNRFFTKFLDKFVEENVQDLHKGIMMLDLGCGAGRHSIYTAKKGIKAYGIDFSIDAIRHCREYAKDEKLENKTEFLVGDVVKLPFKNDQFYFINDSGCFNHILPKHWKEYADEVYRVLKEGGVYRLKTASYRARNVWGYDSSCKNRWVMLKNRHYKYHFNEEELREIFSRFEVVSLKDRFVSKKNRFYFMICQKSLQ